MIIPFKEKFKQCNPAIFDIAKDPWLSDLASRQVWLQKQDISILHKVYLLETSLKSTTRIYQLSECIKTVLWY